MSLLFQNTAPVLLNGNILNFTRKDIFDFGNGLKFNGVNHYIRVPNNISNQIDVNGDLSISFVIKKSRRNLIERILWKADSSGLTRTFDIAFNDNIFFFGIAYQNIRFNYITIDFTPFFDITANVVIIKRGLNANNWDIYVNGILQTKSVGINNLQSTDNETVNEALLIGTESANFLQGNLFDLKIKKVAFSLAEIQNLYQNKNSTTIQNFDFDLRLEEKTGLIANDSSANANHSILENYTLSQVSLGSNNHHIDQNGNSILS